MGKFFIKLFSWVIAISFIPSILVVSGLLVDYQEYKVYCQNMLTYLEVMYWIAFAIYFCLNLVSGSNPEAVKSIKLNSGGIQRKITSVNSIVAAALLVVIMGDISFFLAILLSKLLVCHILDEDAKRNAEEIC